jgi:glycosyltransferase involved in cell wall biosynthesis
MPSEPLRILLVISRLGSGGAEWQLVHLALGLAERGHDVTLCAIHRADPRHREPFARAGVRLIELGADTRGQRARAVPRLARLARQAEVVHCTNWDSSLWGRLAGLLAHRPVVVADHSTDRTVQESRTGAKRGRLVSLHHRLLGRFTAATVACARVQLDVLRDEGVPEERIRYIPNGVPVASIRERARHGVDRAELGLSADAPLLMHIAKFRPEKNQAATLDIVAALRREVPGTEVVFVGHGPRFEPVVQRAAEMGADWATFLGDRDDVPRLLALADLVVLPSLAETMPMVLLEAMAVGTPIVATAVAGVPALLKETGAGTSTAPGDLDAFVEAARAILTEERTRERMAAGAALGAETYDSSTMVDRYEELLLAAARN